MAAIKAIHYSTLARIFELEGWVYNRTKGDHFIYVKTGYKRAIVIPKWE